jgi:hypothetical protein
MPRLRPSTERSRRRRWPPSGRRPGVDQHCRSR